MSQLGDNLKNATADEVAKVATDRKITLADDDIDALAAHITSVVLEELAIRELQGREVASRDETTNTWAEHSVRIDEYAEAARDLRFGASGEDRSEPTPATRVWRAGDRAAHAGIPGRITFVGGATAPWEFTPDHGDAFRFYNATALSEVVTPLGTP